MNSTSASFLSVSLLAVALSVFAPVAVAAPTSAPTTQNKTEAARFDDVAAYELSLAFFGLNLSPLVPTSPEFVKTIREGEAVVAKLRADAGYVAAEAAVQAAYRVAATADREANLKLAREGLKTAWDTAQKALSPADAKTLARYEAQRGQADPVTLAYFDFHPGVRAAHKAYTAARAECLKEYSAREPLLKKIAAIEAKNKGNETTELQLLRVKAGMNRNYGRCASPAEWRAVMARDAYRAELKKAVGPFTFLRDTIVGVDINDPLLVPFYAPERLKLAELKLAEYARKAAEHAALRAWYREQEAGKLPAVAALAKSRDQSLSLVAKAEQKQQRAERASVDFTCKSITGSGDDPDAKVHKEAEAAVKACIAARADYEKAVAAYENAVFVAALAKLPAVSAPALAKIEAAFRAEPFDQAAYEAAHADYQAQAQPVPGDASTPNLALHWPELGKPEYYQNSTNPFSITTTTSPAGNTPAKPVRYSLRRYIWRKTQAGAPAKSYVEEGCPYDPFASFSKCDGVAAAEIAMYAKVPNYPAYTFAQARVDARALLEKQRASAQTK